MVSTADIEYIGGGAAIGGSLGYLWRKKIGLLVGAILGAVAGYLVEKYLPTGQIGGKPASLTSGNPNVSIGGTTAQQTQTSIESIPVVGNLLAQEFTASYNVGAAVGNAINTVVADGESLLKSGGLLSYLKI